MRLGLCLALAAACLAFDRDVGYLMTRNIQDAANGQLRCFVGIVTDYNNTSIGTEVFCNGLCGSIRTSAGGYNFTTYNCFPQSFCSAAGLNETCATVFSDRDLTGCCCGTDNCNVAGTNINTTIPIAPPEEPIACYSGVSINGVNQAGSDWIACQGDCVSVTINTTMNGKPMVGSIFSCDPTSVCTALNIVNRCHDIEPGVVRGCCCTTDACINPTLNPPKEPRGPLSCYVGLYSKAANISVGQEVFCDGKCASLSSTVAGGDIVVFECAPKEACHALTLYNDCQTITADRDITGCCCDNANNCNAANYSLGEPRPRYEGDFPVACFSGIRVNGKFITPAKWTACQGDCASVMINTTMAMGPMSAEIFTCDPASVCNQLGMVNNCTTVESGVSGCCCSYDACIDPTRYPNKYPGNPLKCYVGFQSTFNGGITVGSEVFCNGMCGALNAMVNGQNITTYMCTPRSICRQLELYDTMKPLPTDREVRAMCCDNFNNCNVRDPSIDTSMPVRRLPEFPITCYNGIQVNGNWVTNAGWQSCNGDCASMNIVTQYNGQTHNLNVYMCDPTSVCKGLNMTNSCSSIEPGVSGCCCNTNGCIDPTKNPAKTPANKLQCYVGLYAAKANVNVGAEVYCNGKCASLRGIVNGDDVTTFQCVPSSICRSLELDDACMHLPGDREVRACCCDNVNSCNVALQNRTDIISPSPSPIVEYPISCWTGIYLNGYPLTEVGFQTCNGQCASVTLNTTLNGLPHSASVYMCDPTAVCKALNMTNTCSTVEPGLGGCCCNSDACIYPPRNRNPGNPLQCYVGLYAPNAGVNVGAEVVCDGQCSSLSGIVNGDKVTTFQCVPLNVCKSLELDNACNGLPGDREVTACCCDSSNSCNIANYADVITPPTPPPFTEFPISCWSGAYVNGAPITNAGYQSCNGECASVTLQTTLAGNQHNATLYLCDPTSVCQALNMNNKCATVEPGVSGCCCDTDACLSPQKSPSNPLTCYVGINAPKANINVGAEVVCNGMCSSLNAMVNGDNVTTFQCVPKSVCKSFSAYNSCNSLKGDREVTGCCCDTANACNLASRPDIIPPTPAPNTEFPISCWSGIYVNGNPLSNPGYQSCKGECASLTLTTTLQGQTHNATMYTCDPTSVCKSLNMSNQCVTLESGVSGCCCNSDACLTPRKNPSNPLQCYVGLYAPNAGVNVGAEVYCDGMCSSLSGKVNGDSITTFQCVPTTVCKSLGVDNACSGLPGDREVTGCCCDYKNSCSLELANRTDITPPTPPPNTEFPISCWSGIYLNGNPLTNAGYQSCQGECASVTLQTVVGGAQHNATIYMCDPTSVCQALNMSNRCAVVEPGLSGCCCNDDACLTPKKSPSNSLTCFVGIRALKAGVNVGAEVVCNGMCSSLNAMVNNDNVTTFQCVPTSVCKSFAADNGCSTLRGDREVTGCCCDTSNACNLAGYPDIPVPTIPPRPEFPISCWSGIYVNGRPLSKPSFQSCSGECASLTLVTTIQGQTHNATMYTCDPTSVCKSLGVVNNCTTIEQGISTCCCDTDACLAPWKTPGKPLLCYVGLYAPKAGVNVGAEVACDGMCSSLNGMVNGDNVTTFQCVPSKVCKTFLNMDGCSTLQGDREVTGCCCQYRDSCNVHQINRTDIIIPTPSPVVEYPISCWTGIYVNGAPLTDVGFQTCNGQCASITLNTTISSVSHTATAYMCDPTAICKALKMVNKCASVEPGLGGCCCDTDACIYPPRNRSPANPLQCYVGLYAPKAGVNVGAEVPCEGQCSSLNGIVNGDNVTTFQCAPLSLCKSLELDNACGSLPGDREIKACCCDGTNSCNVANNTNIIPPTVSPVWEYPISCWTGVYVNGNPITKEGFRTCFGECASITLQTSIGSTQHNATMYMCDPTAVCRSLNMTNQCSTIEPGVSGCCCNTDACLTPRKSPDNQLTCYVGMYAKKANINTGAEVVCNGKCSSIRAVVNGDDVTAFQCMPTSACKYLAVNNGCTQLPGDREVSACCCDNANACNVVNRTDIIVPTPSPVPEFPISCWSGVYVHGNPITNVGFQTCNGECASFTLTTTINGETHTAAVYTCDPTSVCSSMGMINNCLTIETGVQGCCCNTDGCLTPNKKPGNVLWCYVGLYAKKAGINVGGEVACDGQCSSLSGIVNGDSVTTFQCVPTTVCKSLAANNGCVQLPTDREIQGCCCDGSNSCNLYQLNRTDIIPPTPAPVSEFPISCWTGVYVNGNAITNAGYQTCYGECASVTLQTTVSNQQHNATIFMCDPTAVCQSLNMSNACATIEPGLSGCCCNDDACLTPTKSPATNPLMCYVGINAPKAGVNVGAEVPCHGMCSTLNAIVNGDNVTTFQCSPKAVCKSFAAYNGCNTLKGDREVTGCCCDGYNACNLASRPDIVAPSPAPVREYPISCWTGVYVNNKALSNPGFTTCFGECASVTLNTTMNQQNHTASLYMCDPTSICRALNMSNTCSTVEPGLGGCCCDTDACLNPITNTYPGNDLICYVGIYYEKDNYSVGSEMKCNGKCASLKTSFAGKTFKSYHCAPTTVCKALTVDNSCGPVYKDSDVTACCCDNAKNCNVQEPISTNNTAPAFTGTPIACQSGIYVDGAAITADNTFIACKGQCAKLSYSTNMTGAQHTLDLYTCDPASVCSGLGLSNSCASIDGTAVSGCCCNYDSCVTPSVTPTPPSGGSASLSLSFAIIAAVYTIFRQ